MSDTIAMNVLLAEIDDYRLRITALEAELARYEEWHDDVMSRSRSGDFFDGYGNTLRLTPIKPAKEG